MADPKPPTYRAPPAPRAGGSRDAFDVWLRVSLRRIYDAVAAEPVPEALRQLAAAHGGRERGKAAPASARSGRRSLIHAMPAVRSELPWPARTFPRRPVCRLAGDGHIHHRGRGEGDTEHVTTGA